MSSVKKIVDNSALPKDYRPRFRLRFFALRNWAVWIVLALFGLCVLLPRPFSGYIGARLGDLFRCSNRKRRNVVDVNLRMCFPEMSAEEHSQLSRAHFRVFGQSLVDMGLIWWARKKFLEDFIDIEGLEHYRAAIESGRNIILLTGHFSALDIAAAAISSHYPQTGLINPAENEVVDYFMAYGRRRFDCKVFLRDKGMRPIIKAIKAGYGFYYLPDEDLGPEKSIFVPFMGSESATITALNKLARLTNAAVLPTSVCRVSAREGYRIKIHPAMDNFPSDDPVADAVRMNAELARMIADAPEQYMWTLKIFTTRPDGGPQPYDSH